MTKGKQKTPGDSGILEASEATPNELQDNVSSEADSGESSLSENLQATIEVHSTRVSFAKQSRGQGTENQELSETRRDQPLKPGQNLERRDSLENERCKYKNLRSEDELRGKGILRTGAVKKSKNPRQRNFESGGLYPNTPTHPEERTGKLRQSSLESGKAVESGGFDSNIGAHLEEGNVYGNGDQLHKTARTSTIVHRHQRKEDVSEIEENSETTAGEIPPSEGLNSVTQDQIFSFHIRSFLKYHRDRYSRQLKNSRKRIREWWKNSTCRRQMTKEWIYYVLWLAVCCLCLVWTALACPNERDIPICLIMVITFCCGATLLCKRECLVDWLNYICKRIDIMDNAERLQDEFQSVRLKKAKCFDCFSCSSEEHYELPRRRHWYVNRRTELENRNTAFEHEVVDVSKLKPEECPQIRQMEMGDSELAESVSSVSSDSPKERLWKKAEAHVHNLEAADTQRKLDDYICQFYNLTCSVPEGEKQTHVIPHIKYVSHVKKQPEPKNTPRDEDGFKCEHHGQDKICDCAGLAEIVKAKEASLMEPADDVSNCEYCGNNNVACICHEQVEKYEPEIASPRESSPEEGFICEHFGQAVACGCFELAEKHFLEHLDDTDDVI